MTESEVLHDILEAYRQGAFPMGYGEEGIRWYEADPRAILPPDGLRVSRSLRGRVRSRRFRVTCDTAFESVVHACARRRPDGNGGSGTWITEDMVRVYALLHRAGHAHSIEAWIVDADGTTGERDSSRLVGGLYGVAIGACFCGESMFCRPDLGGTDASKVCLVHLVSHLRGRGFTLIDSQFTNPHMERMGVVEIPAIEYRRRLREALGREPSWDEFDPDRALRELDAGIRR